jgi:hypothetical protein
MFSEGIIYLISLTVCITGRFTTPLANFMYYVGTGKFNQLQFMWKRTSNDDVLSVLTWFLHITYALIFYLFNAPILNFLYQVLLGTVIQHMFWTVVNIEKRFNKPNLFVPFWFLSYWEMWSVITVTLLPMSVGIYIV